MQKLSWRQIGIVYCSYAAGLVYLLTDQLYVVKSMRFAMLLGVFALMFSFLFVWFKTKTPFALAGRLSFLLVLVIFPVYVVQDLISSKNFTLKPVLVILAALAFPYLIALFFYFLRPKAEY